MSALDGKHLVVIGGSSGIGLATARRALAFGAHVTVVGRSRDKLDALDLKVERFAVDVSDYSSCAHLFDSLEAVDHICHCAAPPSFNQAFKDLSLQAAQEHFAGRFWSAFNVAKFAATLLPDNGSLTFVIGALSRRPMKGRAIVTAAQSAVEGLARGLCIDLAPRRVNTVLAGLTNTGMWSDMAPGMRKQMFESYTASAPAGIVAEPQHVAAMIIQAISNPSVTGSTLLVEGGSTLV